ncbi:hypothetical protein HOY80DRAFT_1141234 [Tuber brumale]|nr:hypothetical protein HOY80DRAFT_1141234 [Tuber brumale]
MDSRPDTTKADRGRKRESETHREKRKAAHQSRTSIVEADNLDEEKKLERKKRRVEKRKARRARERENNDKGKVSSVQVEINGKPVVVGVKDKPADKMKPGEQQVFKKGGTGNQGMNQDPSTSNQKKVKTDNITRHNVQVAATGLFAYIAIDPKLSERTMDDWVDATVVALSHSLRPAAIVSYLAEPRADPNIKKKTKGPLALTARFRTEEELRKALGPITIEGFDTEVVRYQGGKGCTFKIPLGTWGLEEEKIMRAFEIQAMAEVKAWGWRQLHGTKTHLVLQSVWPPGRNRGRPDMLLLWRDA